MGEKSLEAKYFLKDIHELEAVIKELKTVIISADMKKADSFCN